MSHVVIDLHRPTVVIAAVDDSGRTINPVTFDCRETSAIVEHLCSLRPFRAVIEATRRRGIAAGDHVSVGGDELCKVPHGEINSGELAWQMHSLGRR